MLSSGRSCAKIRAMILLLLIVFGLIFGSFVNALVWRLHRQEELQAELSVWKKSRQAKSKARQIKQAEAELRELSVAQGRSMCSNCRHPLAPLDLIPLISWLALRGKCRYCRQPIQDPPLVELVLPLLFVVSYLFWPLPLAGSTYGLISFLFWLVFLVGFTALSLYDIRWYLLPDKIVWPLAGLAFLQVIVHMALSSRPGAVAIEAVWGVLIASGVFYILYTVAERLKRQWIGFGDVKLGIVLGLLAGGPLKAILLLYIASLVGLLASLPLILSKRLSRGSLIPYGPSLMLACVIVVLASPQLTALTNRLIWGI